MSKVNYEDYEVGAGWVDPRNLASRLKSRVRLLCDRQGNGAGSWIGAIALSLVVLSWWNEMSVQEVFAWLGKSILQLFS